MKTFEHLRKRLMSFDTNIKDIKDISIYIDNQEKYYNSIPINIKTNNTFNIIYNILENKINQLEKTIQQSKGIDYERQIQELKAAYSHQLNINESNKLIYVKSIKDYIKNFEDDNNYPEKSELLNEYKEHEKQLINFMNLI
jgi:hypothetical protein